MPGGEAREVDQRLPGPVTVVASTVPLAPLSSSIVQPARPGIATAVIGAIAVDVVELLAADAAELEVAEVVAGAGGGAGDRDVSRIDRRLDPADLTDLADAVGAVGQAGEGVNAAGPGCSGGIDGAVGVFVELDGPAGNARSVPPSSVPSPSMSLNFLPLIVPVGATPNM